jgi:transcriptional regulator with XRE-family HTH domain
MTERFDEKVKKALGRRLKKARELHYANAALFARALGVEDHTYRSWEAGKHMPNVAVLTRICQLLKVEPNDLLPLALRPRQNTSEGGQQNIAS